MSTRDLAYLALFAAVTAALGVLPAVALPFVPVPVTAQTLGPMLAGSVLGARRAGLSQLVFVVLVAAGLPLLAGGRGGLGVFAGPSGGFVLAFPIGAFVVGLVTERFWKRYTLARALVATVSGGILAVYAVGIPYLAVMGDLTVAEAAVGSLAFVPGDLVKAAVASSVAVTVRRAYPVMEPR
jgi:biotin transport system substrate-specific component